VRPIFPVDVWPENHELFKASSTTAQAGDVIQHDYLYPWFWWNMTELSAEPTPALGLPFVDMPGPTAFYAYGYPYYWSANTGQERSNTATMITLKDDAKHLFIIYILDMAWDGAGGTMNLDIQAGGSILPGVRRKRELEESGKYRKLSPSDRQRCENQGNPVQNCLYALANTADFLDQYRPDTESEDLIYSMLDSDYSLDTNGELNIMWRDDPWNSFLYNQITGYAEFSWHWLECCTDGIIIGPLPRSSLNPWELVFSQRCHKMDGLEQGTRIQQWHPYDQEFIHIDVPMHQSCVPPSSPAADGVDEYGSFGGIRIGCEPCDEYCGRFTICGECAANLYCGWDDVNRVCVDGTQNDGQTAFNTSYVPEKYSAGDMFTQYIYDTAGCNECTALTSEYECVSTPGCGWAYFEGTCCSGTPDFPSCPDATVVQWDPPNQCYKAAYNEKRAFAGTSLEEEQTIYPVPSYPADHPKVADGVADCGSRRKRKLQDPAYATFQGGGGLFEYDDFTDATEYNDNQPCAYIPGTLKMACENGYGEIPATDYWSRKGEQGCPYDADTGSGDASVKAVTGAEAFYAYGYPRNYSSNTGNERHNAIVSHLIVDTKGEVYMIVTIDKAYDGSGGNLVINMETTGITTQAPVVFFDDPEEPLYDHLNGGADLNLDGTFAVPGNYEYSSEYNNGTFSFHWNDYAGDGFVFGPMPPSDWTINMAVERKYTDGLDSFIVGSYDSTKNDLDYVTTVPIKKAQEAWGGVQLEGTSCTGMCQASYGSDCTACMKDENCKFSASHGGCISQASYVYEFTTEDYRGRTTRCTGATQRPDLKVMQKNQTLYPGTETENTVVVRIGAEGMDTRCPCSSLYGIFVAVYTWDMRLVEVAENIPVRDGKRYTFVEIPGMHNDTYYNYYAYVCMMQGTVMRDDCSPAAIESGRLLYE